MQIQTLNHREMKSMQNDVKNKMNIIYIDYADLCESSEKRILYLEAIKKLINTDKNSLRYHDLKLFDKNVKNFVDLLNKKKEFKQFFVPFSDHVEVVGKIDGEIIVGTSLLLRDLEKFRMNLMKKSYIPSLLTEIRNGKRPKNDVSEALSEVTNLILSPAVFRWWLFKYIDTSLLPHSNEGSKIYRIYLKTLDEDKIKQFFDLDVLREEVKKFPDRKKSGEIKDDDVKQIASFIDGIFEDIIEKHPSNSVYWNDMRHEVRKIFSIPPTPPPLTPPPKNQKLVLVMQGDKKINPENPIISKYLNKIILFNNSISLSKTLKVGNVVLGTIKREINYCNVIIVNPEKVLDKDEVVCLLEKGVDAIPSREKILESLRGL